MKSQREKGRIKEKVGKGDSMLRVFLSKDDGYELLARAVRLVWGMDALPEILRAEGGKPCFKNFPQRHFNLSHSGEFALCALSDAPVGADIEVVRPRKEGLPAYVFKGEEHGRYLALGGDWDAFYALWTEVESIIKYTGEGLKAYRRAALPEGCVLSNLSGDGWKGAVCAHEPIKAAEWLE